MSVPILVAAMIMTVAVIGHVLVGTRETARLEPSGDDPKLMNHFVQSMCAFQMLTPDLIIVTALLYTLALTDVLQPERMIALCVAGYFALQGVMWLGHILWMRRPGVTWLSLPHWMVWLLCAGLVAVGA